MIPVQDVVPSGRRPAATLALIGVNALVFAAQAITPVTDDAALFSAFVHPSTAHFIITVLFLWLFGDNVEARIGRIAFVAAYIVCGTVGSFLAVRLTSAAMAAPLGAVFAVSGVLGAYFVLLPNSRVLVLVPAPPLLTETPALLFLGMWGILQVVSLIVLPGSTPWTLLALAAPFAIGAAICLATRPRMVWMD